MPGFLLRRRGTPRHCQGNVISDWIAVGPDGTEQMIGSSVFEFSPDGLIDSVIGFAGPS